MENKEILFRGISIETKQFVYGYYNRSLKPVRYGSINTYDRILKDSVSNIFVIPETVGQFTGLLDKNGKKVFEGDEIIYNYGFDDDSQPRVSTVKRGDITSDWETCSGLVFESHHYSDSITEVIGTIHDHLLE